MTPAEQWRVEHEERKVATQDRNWGYFFRGLEILVGGATDIYGSYAEGQSLIYAAGGAGSVPAAPHVDSTTVEGQPSPGQGVGVFSAISTGTILLVGAIAGILWLIVK